jgi:hypothetical protein
MSRFYKFLQVAKNLHWFSFFVNHKQALVMNAISKDHGGDKRVVRILFSYPTEDEPSPSILQEARTI